jgi:hypothetical protein
VSAADLAPGEGLRGRRLYSSGERGRLRPCERLGRLGSAGDTEGGGFGAGEALRAVGFRGSAERGRLPPVSDWAVSALLAMPRVAPAVTSPAEKSSYLTAPAESERIPTLVPVVTASS